MSDHIARVVARAAEMRREFDFPASRLTLEQTRASLDQLVAMKKTAEAAGLQYKHNKKPSHVTVPVPSDITLPSMSSYSSPIHVTPPVNGVSASKFEELQVKFEALTTQQRQDSDRISADVLRMRSELQEESRRTKVLVGNLEDDRDRLKRERDSESKDNRELRREVSELKTSLRKVGDEFRSSMTAVSMLQKELQALQAQHSTVLARLDQIENRQRVSSTTADSPRMSRSHRLSMASIASGPHETTDSMLQAALDRMQKAKRTIRSHFRPDLNGLAGYSSSSVSPTYERNREREALEGRGDQATRSPSHSRSPSPADPSLSRMPTWPDRETERDRSPVKARPASSKDVRPGIRLDILSPTHRILSYGDISPRLTDHVPSSTPYATADSSRLRMGHTRSRSGSADIGTRAARHFFASEVTTPRSAADTPRSSAETPSSVIMNSDTRFSSGTSHDSRTEPSYLRPPLSPAIKRIQFMTAKKDPWTPDTISPPGSGEKGSLASI